jgi:hypothetical protein
MRWLGLTTLASLLSACLSGTGGPSSPQLVGDGTRILFIGNSHTYVNDVPGILQSLADSAEGERIAVASIALPNYALIDHWMDGVAAREIAKGGWGWVVMQQGWTPGGIYRDTLRLAAKNFGVEISKIGATGAMYQTWPPTSRPQDFEPSILSYELAATDINGVVLPVARAWLETWKRDPNAALYAPDGLHASVTGSYLAAVVMYARILNRSPVGLPARLRTRAGNVVTIDPALARVLQDAAATVTAGASVK